MDSTKAENQIALYWKRLVRLSDFAFIKKLKITFPASEIYLVGGAVRDIILNNPTIVDFDFVTRGIPAKKLGEFLKKFGAVNLVGKKFGVYKFKAHKSKIKEEIDIALPRTEAAWEGSGAHRDFKVTTDEHLHIEADLSRRDFTINAMAWDIFGKRLIDPYGGIVDLKNKIIDTVGIPSRRFAEDLARILRAIRFSCQLNIKIEPRVWRALKRQALKINSKDRRGEWIVSREVIAKELLKSFLSSPVRAFDLYYASGLTEQLMPELLKMHGCPQPKNYHSEGDVWTHTRLALEKLQSIQYKRIFPNDIPTSQLIMAVLFHDIAKPLTIRTPQKHGTDRIRFHNHDYKGAKVAAKICRRLKLSSWGEGDITCEHLAWLVKKHMLLVHGKVDIMKNSTLEKYFFNDNVPGKELLQLFFADSAATLPPSGRADLTSLKKLLARLKTLGTIIKKKNGKNYIINGNDVMKHFKLSEGPEIGRLLQIVREAQLGGQISTKKDAFLLLKKELGK